MSADLRHAIAGYGAKQEIADEDTESLAKVSEEAPIVRIAYAIVQQAIKDGASDIHIEPDRRGTRVRYRIDGVLHEEMSLPKYIDKPLVSRFKIMSDMDIAERRIPQDGRIPIRWDNRDYDLRVSCLPTVHGEKIVMRILDKGNVLIGLNRLGFTAGSAGPDRGTYGPAERNVPDHGAYGKRQNHHSVFGSAQTQLHRKEHHHHRGPGRISALGHIAGAGPQKGGAHIRQRDEEFPPPGPGHIMVGEMRDLETAEIGIEASLTGHLVLSTLHTNDAPSAVIRMVDMGVEPYLISATVIACLAQRLARKVCSKCKAPYQVPGTELRKFGFKPKDPNEMVTLYRGEGCDACKMTGYKGRIGIYETDENQRRNPRTRGAARAAGRYQGSGQGVWNARTSGKMDF